jgi:hypothetical protein
MAPQVLYRVLFGDSKPPKKLRDQLTIVPAVLPSYCRHKVYMVDYPGIIPQEGKSVLGVYVTGLNDTNIRRLDAFEGDQYRREKVKVKLLEGVQNLQVGGTEGRELEAETYIFIDKGYLAEEEWDFQEFVTEKMWRWADTSNEYDGECSSRNKAGRHGEVN